MYEKESIMKGSVDTKIPYLTSLSYLQAQRINFENAKSQDVLKNSIEHISTGLRVINASDDLAGFSIANRFETQALGLTSAIKNTNDALSATRTAEASVYEYMNILGYMKELAERSSHDVVENSERQSLQKEMEMFQERLRNLADETSFKGRKLLDGTYQSQEMQVGEKVGHLMSISMKSARPDQVGLHQLISEGDMNDAGNFRSSIYAAIDNGISSLDSLTIQGFIGSEFIEVENYSSAKEIAQLINQKSELTGVNASAGTYAKIYNLSQTGDVSFTIHGASDVQISATIESTDDLTPLYELVSRTFDNTCAKLFMSL